MPKTTVKIVVERFLEQLVLFNMIEVEIYDGNEKKLDDVVELLSDFYAVFSAFRYSVPFIIGSIPKSQKFLLEIVPQLDDDRFKVLFRMSRSTFAKLLHLIEDDEIFQYKGIGRKQAPVVIQLQVALYRIGSSISLTRLAFLFGIGDGGTAINFCRRVFLSILKRRKQYLFWPNSDERRIICAATFHEMPHCIGYVDGTEIKLTEAPRDDPDAYLSRKQVHSLKVQITCDHKFKIRHLITGYPGSVHDSRIYNQCKLASDPTTYFSNNEYLLGDSAYKLTNTVITPFRQNARGVGSTTVAKSFNRRLSKYRVRVENTIGSIKERFESLKDLRVSINDSDSSKFANDWIMVCAILYNFIVDQKNSADLIRFEEILAHEILNEDDQEITDSSDGESKRTAIMNFLFN